MCYTSEVKECDYTSEVDSLPQPNFPTKKYPTFTKMWYNIVVNFNPIGQEPMNTKRGLELELPDQKEKQHSFQEIPLLINGTLRLSFSQGGNYGD